MRRYTAAVVGLGNIGLRADLGAINEGRIASHAKAFASHQGYKLVGGVDPDVAGRNILEQRYEVPGFADIEAMRSAGINPEVWSIAVPTIAHFPVFNQIMAIRSVAVLCEKPVAGSVAEAESMVKAAADRDTVLAVNYMRRFEPGVLALRRLIHEGVLGEVYKGVAWYSKGLLNNGSHLVDLLIFLLGKATAVNILDAGRVWQGGDPEPDIRLTFGATSVVFLAAREECFSHFGFELSGTWGMVRYADGGHRIEVRRAMAHPEMPSYQILENEPDLLGTDMKHYQWHSVDALHRHLEVGDPLHSNGLSALETLRTIDQVLSALPLFPGRLHT